MPNDRVRLEFCAKPDRTLTTWLSVEPDGYSVRIGALHAAAVQVRNPKDSLKGVGCPATPDADHSQAPVSIP
jgi:uncharacterized heparinase superfamily protein